MTLPPGSNFGKMAMRDEPIRSTGAIVADRDDDAKNEESGNAAGALESALASPQERARLLDENTLASVTQERDPWTTLAAHDPGVS